MYELYRSAYPYRRLGRHGHTARRRGEGGFSRPGRREHHRPRQRLRRAGGDARVEERQADVDVGIFVVDGHEDVVHGKPDGQLLAAFAHEGVRLRLAGLDLAADELP